MSHELVLMLVSQPVEDKAEETVRTAADACHFLRDFDYGYPMCECDTPTTVPINAPFPSEALSEVAKTWLDAALQTHEKEWLKALKSLKDTLKDTPTKRLFEDDTFRYKAEVLTARGCHCHIFGEDGQEVRNRTELDEWLANNLQFDTATGAPIRVGWVVRLDMHW